MGTIFDIKHYAIHDGPGIRTTVFLKGCPLNCLWCHNPESKSYQPEFMWTIDRCIGCLSCIESCQFNAIQLNEKLEINENKCNFCLECVSSCYTEALEIIGKEMSVEEVFREIAKDSVFYEESGGGVTLSGGEPLAQPEFLIKLLTLCKKEGIHTTLDTCGYAEQEIILRVIDLVDLYLYDLKHMDDEKHLKYVGVSNKPILRNLKLLKEKNVIVRFPLIPKINDNVKNIQEMGDFLSNNGFKEVNILPYHKAGSEKIPRLNRPSEVYTFESPDEETLDKIKKILDEFGLKVKIGG